MRRPAEAPKGQNAETGVASEEAPTDAAPAGRGAWGGAHGNSTLSPDRPGACRTGAVGSTGTDRPPPLVTDGEPFPSALRVSLWLQQPQASTRHRSNGQRGRWRWQEVDICPSLSEFTAALTQGPKGPDSQPRDLPLNWKVLSLLVLQTGGAL